MYMTTQQLMHAVQQVDLIRVPIVVVHTMRLRNKPIPFLIAAKVMEPYTPCVLNFIVRMEVKSWSSEDIHLS